MLNTSWKLYALLLCGISCTGLQAQEGIPVIGGRSLGTGSPMTFSAIGQIVYTSNAGASSSSAKGLSQSLDYHPISTDCLIYPNPTMDFLTLKIKWEPLNQYQASLYDVHGKLLQLKNIVSDETCFDLREFESANYFLRVFDRNKHTKTFKVIKN